VAVGSVVACGVGARGASDRPVVVSTLTQVSALVRSVGGDRIALTPLLRPADDPHAYELKPVQVTSLAGAAVIFESGVQIDKWLDRGVEAAGVRDRVIDLSQSVRLRQATGADAGPDPHWWYDADNARAAIGAIASALERVDPASRDVYERNAAAERQRLDAADRDVHRAIDPIPPARRLFVANHDAFGYFLDRYGITLVGDIVPSTDSMAAVRPADIAHLVADIQRRHVCAIFTETTIDPRLAEQIGAESKAKVYDGRLYGDAIGEPGGPGGTLESALVRNGRLMAAAFTSC
jgi:ABC-type Zn uptake system ZnuABC Zn-binding protein ZnuA